MSPEEIRARALDAAVYVLAGGPRMPRTRILSYAEDFAKFITGPQAEVPPTTQLLSEDESGFTPAEIWGPPCLTCGHTEGIHLSVRGGCKFENPEGGGCMCPVFQGTSTHRWTESTE